MHRLSRFLLLAFLVVGTLLANSVLALDAAKQTGSPDGLLLRVGRPVSGFAFAPDGSKLVTLSPHGFVQVWEVANGELVTEFAGPGAPLFALAFSPDETLVVAGWASRGLDSGAQLASFDSKTWKRTRLVNLRLKLPYSVPDIERLDFTAVGTRLLLRRREGATLLNAATCAEIVNVPERRESVALSPDGGYLAAWSPGKTELWETATGKTAGVWIEPEPTSETSRYWRRSWDAGIAWSPRGRSLAVSQTEGPALVRDVPSGRVLTRLEPRKTYVRHLAWSPDGKFVAGISTDYVPDYAVTPADDSAAEVSLWEAQTGKLVRSLAGAARLDTLQFIGPNHLLIGERFEPKRIVSISNGQEIARLAESVGEAVANAAGDRIAGARHQGSVAIFDASTGAVAVSLPEGPAPIQRLAFGADGTLIAISEPGTVRAWSLKTGKAAVRVTGPPLQDWRDGFGLSAEGASAITRQSDALIRWDTRSGQQRRRIPLGPREDSYQKLVLARNGALIQGFQYREPVGHTIAAVRVVRASEGKASREKQWPEQYLRHLSLSPRGDLLAVSLSGKAQDDPELLLLHPETLEILYRLDDREAFGDNLAWSGDGSTLAIPVAPYFGDDRRVRVWTCSGARRKVWRERYLSHPVSAERAAVNEDGSRIAVSWADGTLGIWDRANGSIMTLPGGHPGGVNALLWAKDGTRLYSGGKDGRLRTWDAINSKLLSTSADLAPDAWITWKPDETYVASSGAARFIGRQP